MARIYTVGQAAVITSELTLEDIKVIQKYRRDALTLMGGEEGKDAVFTVMASDKGGGINSVGAVFNHATGEHGNACITVMLPDGIEDVKEYLVDKYGQAINCLNKLEYQLPSVLEDIYEEKRAVEDAITIG